MQHARAAIVTRGIETVVAERLHDLDLVLRHGAERIAGMVVAAGRLFGIAVAAQIGGDHGEFLGQFRRDLVPRHVTERIAVHQQQRRPLAAMHGDNARATGLDLGAGETFEHDATVHDHFAGARPAALASSTAIGACLATSAWNCSGVSGIGSTPSVASLPFTSGDSSAFFVS